MAQDEAPIIHTRTLSNREENYLKKIDHTEKKTRKLKIEALKKHRTRYHNFFSDQEVHTIYDSETSITNRLLLLGFIATIFKSQLVFRWFRKYLARGISKEISNRMNMLSLDLFILCMCLSLLKFAIYFGLFEYFHGVVDVADIDL